MLVSEVDAGLEIGQQIEQRFSGRVEVSANAPGHAIQRDRKLDWRTGIDYGQDRFGLQQVKPAGQK